MTPTTPSAGPTAQQLEQRLRETLQPVTLEVVDESFQHNGHAGANGTGFGTHFRVRITSGLFTGKSAVMRHRLVYDALQDFMDQGLHALAIEAQAPTV
ncbi:BolA family transcriptional regulator [Rhodoferax sp.]|jgi:BolA protein|uniref:BolA family protein n=1 Tax=Rhodoferax sp. TaxID=50421 RepID=UPI00271F4EF9|nr:BolA family protein [Rhodoferax sp.]MDO8448300.1 BolA family protein [Rhodoferax sp.]MDO9194874.1 BolA family protein [Rhodoferax sp.]